MSKCFTTRITSGRIAAYFNRRSGCSAHKDLGTLAAAGNLKIKMKSGFIQMLRKRKELIPLIGIVALAAVGATSTSLYFLFTKKDVILNKSTNPEPWERLDPSKPQKLVSINQKWRPIEELELVKSMTK
ncbi:normal mucosa of esophagus-specific gene 1 protein-like [Oncorhynchus masou masou]|uniref:normal mucosa of esophagus-specific gene 1 protein-like n=3 Tax=Oncorhynchus masou masou TaxID=90313 RepID=UPI0031845084